MRALLTFLILHFALGVSLAQDLAPLPLPDAGTATDDCTNCPAGPLVTNIQVTGDCPTGRVLRIGEFRVPSSEFRVIADLAPGAVLNLEPGTPNAEQLFRAQLFDHRTIAWGGQAAAVGYVVWKGARTAPSAQLSWLQYTNSVTTNATPLCPDTNEIWAVTAVDAQGRLSPRSSPLTNNWTGTTRLRIAAE